MSSAATTCPIPPPLLAAGPVSLCFERLIPGDSEAGHVPAYYFRIEDREGNEAGHISFRVGDTRHVRLCAGHIGYAVVEEFRGQGFARHACRALAPFVRSVYDSVIITSDPDNYASVKTIEKLGAEFLEEVPVPGDDSHYARGSRFKRRYRWTP